MPRLYHKRISINNVTDRSAIVPHCIFQRCACAHARFPRHFLHPATPLLDSSFGKRGRMELPGSTRTRGEV